MYLRYSFGVAVFLLINCLIAVEVNDLGRSSGMPKARDQTPDAKTPIALEGETQKNVNILFAMYKLLYGVFDKTIYAFDQNADKGEVLPNWLMTSISTFGLGFQLLIISVMLVLGLKAMILPFFLVYTAMVFVFIGIRKVFY